MRELGSEGARLSPQDLIRGTFDSSVADSSLGAKDLFSIWKDADPDIPVVQARPEAAKQP
jgi:hypothetical protein